MKRLWMIWLFGCLCIPALSAQSLQIKYEPRKVDFPDPVHIVYQPQIDLPCYISGVFYNTGADPRVPCVFRSPVCYTAFFCKMEVESQKAFGIMLKVHAGDYDSYMDQKIPR